MNAADVMTPDVVSAAPDTRVGRPDPPDAGQPHQRPPHRRARPDRRHRQRGRPAPPRRNRHRIRRPHWLELLTSGTRLAADYARSHGRKADEVMTRDVVTVTETTPLDDIVAALRDPAHQTRPGRSRRQAGRHRQPAGPAAGAGQPPRRAPARQGRRRHPRRIPDRIAPAALGRRPVEVKAVVSDGVVHLWGVAPDEAKRQAMRVAAENIPGVRAVEDHMELPSHIDPLDRPNWPSPVPP